MHATATRSPLGPEWPVRAVAVVLACLAGAAPAGADAPAAATQRVGERSNGVEGDDDSFSCSISGDGTVVGFTTEATNISGRDRNGRLDVFVHDRDHGRTRRVSIRSDGREANGASYDAAMSAGGRFVAFVSTASNLARKGDRNRAADVFVHDRRTKKTNRVSVHPKLRDANGPSYSPSMSAGGRFVAFVSYATDLVPRDTNGVADVFVYDRVARTTVRVSVSSAGAQADGPSAAPVVSAGGGFVAFHSAASNLFEGDTNGLTDVFVHDLGAGVTGRAGRGMAGEEPNGDSFMPSLSGDGRYVGFQSTASNLSAGDTNGSPGDYEGLDVFRYDRWTGRTVRVSVSSTGAQADGPSNDSGHDRALPADGALACFTSPAANLPDDDTNEARDVFVRGPLP